MKGSSRSVLLQGKRPSLKDSRVFPEPADLIGGEDMGIRFFHLSTPNRLENYFDKQKNVSIVTRPGAVKIFSHDNLAVSVRQQKNRFQLSPWPTVIPNIYRLGRPGKTDLLDQVGTYLDTTESHPIKFELNEGGNEFKVIPFYGEQAGVSPFIRQDYFLRRVSKTHPFHVPLTDVWLAGRATDLKHIRWFYTLDTESIQLVSNKNKILAAIRIKEQTQPE